MARNAASVALLNRELDTLDGRSVKASTSTGSLERQIVQTTRSIDDGGNSIDKYSGRLSLLAQAAAVLGPALIPIGAVGVPAITGLATAATAGAVAGGSLLVAFQGVGDAMKAMQEYKLDPTSDNMKKLREAMNGIGQDARTFVHEWQNFRPVLADIRNSAARGWFPGLIESLDDFEDLAPKVAEMLEGVGRAGGQMVAETAESFNSERWSPFFDFVNAELPGALISLSDIVGDLTHGAAEMWMAFDPSNDSFLEWLEGVASGFDDWASSASGREDIAAFLDYVQETGPQVEAFFLATVDALTQMTQAAAPLGGPVLQGLTAVANAVAAIADSDLGTPIFTGLAALSLYNRALATTAALQAKVATPTGPISGLASKGSASVSGGLGALLTVTSAQDRARMSADQLAAAEGRRAAAVRQGAAASLKGAAAAGGLALAFSGAADGSSLSNTASLALLGTLGGPWGAAMGGAIGLTMDLAAANDGLEESLRSVNAALDVGALAEAQSSFASTLKELDALRDSLGNPLDVTAPWQSGWLDQVKNGPASIKNSIEGWFGDSDVEEATQRVDAVDERMRNLTETAVALAQATGATLGPIDGSDASLRELGDAIQAAQPKMDELRFTFEDLALAQKVADGTATSFEAVLATTNPTLDDMLTAISGGTAATMKYSDTMRESAQAARDEARGLREAAQAMRDKTRAALGAFDAETRYREALKAALQQSRRNNAGIEGSTKAALANRASLSELASAWNNQSKAVKNNVDRFRESRKAFVDTATAMGVPEEAAKRLAQRYLEIPKSIVTKIEARGAAEAEAAAIRVQNALDNIRDRTVFIRTISSSVQAARDPSAPLATPQRRAGGGLLTGPGGPRDDLIPVMASNREYVVQASAVEHYGVDFFDRANAKRLAGGGSVGGTTGGNGDDRTQRDIARGLKALTASLDRATDAFSDAKADRQAVISAVTSGLMSDPFAASASSNIFASGATASGIADPNGALRQQNRDAREYKALMDRFTKGKRGLSGAALAEVDTLAEAQALAGKGRDYRRTYQRLFDRRESLVSSAASANANGSAATVAELRQLRGDVHRLEAAVKAADKGNRDGHANAPRMAGEAFGEQLDFATRRASREARQ